MLLVLALIPIFMGPSRAECQHDGPAQATPRPREPSSRRRPPTIFPIARLGAGPRLTLDGEHAGAWNGRAGLAIMRQTRPSVWWRLEADLGYYRQQGAQGLGGGVVMLYGSLAYFQAGYSVRALALYRDDFDFAIRHGLATRFFAGLLAFDVEHERFPGTGTDALVFTFSIDLAGLAAGVALLANGAPL